MSILFYAKIGHTSESNQGTVRVTDTYRFVCDVGDTAAVVWAALPVTLYEVHPLFPIARAKSAGPVRNSGTEGWIFDCPINYDSEPFQEGISGGQDFSQTTPSEDPAENDAGVPPETRPWLFSYGHEMISEPMEYDAVGNHLVNTAGQKFAPPPEIERPRRIIRLTAWMPLDFPALTKGDEYIGTVNNATWATRYTKYEALCTTYDPTIERVQDTEVWRIDIEIAINKVRTLTDGRKLGGWQPYWIPNMGTMRRLHCHNANGDYDPELPCENAINKPILDEFGRPIVAPVFLNSVGCPASRCLLESDPGPDNQHVDPSDPLKSDLHLPFWPFTEKNFNNMLSA